MYVPAGQPPDIGAPMPDAVVGLVKVKHRPYVGTPMMSLSLGVPNDTQYCDDQFYIDKSISQARITICHQ